MRYATTLAGVVLVLAAVGCGGGSSGTSNTPTNPTPSTTTTTTPTNPPVQTTTITITASGVNPQRITVSPGTRVTFVNNDTRQHEMNSDPHPTHGDCPPIDDVGFLSPGQSKQTGNLTTARTCGYHDHNQPDTANLKGQIVIQ
jgi:plastocyanin